MEPSVLPPLSFMVAVTVTVGELCADALFVRMNVTVLAVPDTVPPFAAVRTMVPEVFAQSP